MHGDPTLCPRDAEALDRSIVARLGQPGTSIELYEMMGRMRDTFSYKRFGFDTWEEYMVDRTAEYTILTVSRESLVWMLRDLGYTCEYIGKKLGISEATARRDAKKKPEQLRQNDEVGRSKGKDGKSRPNTYKKRGKLASVPDLPDDEDEDESLYVEYTRDPLDVDEVEEEDWEETEEPQDDSLQNARVRDKRPNPFMCDIDTWDSSYQLFNRMLDQGIGALLRNPTYLEAEKVETLLRKALVRIGKIKQDIEAAHTERQAAQ